MTSFFCIFSIAYHTSVPVLRKCMDTSRKKVFWLTVQPLMHHLLSLDLKDLPPIASLSGPMTWKSVEARSGEYSGCGRHSKDRSWIVATVEWAVWGQALSCCNKTPVLRSPPRLDFIVGCTWLFRSAYVALFSVPPGHAVLQDYPSFIPKESQHNLSRCAWPGRGESVTELVPFMKFLVHSYTCCSDRHASPYWTFIRRWILMGFTPSLLKKWMTEHCSLLVHVASRAAIFTLLLCRCVTFLYLTNTCRPLFKPSVPLLSPYKTIELCFEFLSHF